MNQMNSSEIDGFDKILVADQNLIDKLIEEENRIRTAPLPTSYGKKIVTTGAAVHEKEKKKKLKMLKTPSMKVMFTNADQFTHSKKNELEQRIVTEKPMIVAVSEVNQNMGRTQTKPITASTATVFILSMWKILKAEEASSSTRTTHLTSR